MYSSQRTLYGVDLQLAQLLGKNYNPHPGTTLNQLFGVMTTETIPKGKYPLLRYFCIGIGGAGMAGDTGNYPYNYHSPLDAGLFDMVPFVLREPSNDISFGERRNYRLRASVRINGISYIGYYLKRVDLDRDIIVSDNFDQISRRDNVETFNEYSLDGKDLLHPTPISKLGKVVSSNSSYVIKSAKFVCRLTTYELDELKKAIDIIKPDTNITEIGLVTAHEPDEMEVVCAQIAFHVSVGIDLNMYINTSKEFYRSFDLGGQEPLFFN